jgi:hypothetical protein
MTNRKNLMNYQELLEWEKIVIANGSFMDTDGKGDLKIGEVFRLKKTIHIPDSNKMLISVTKMNNNGYCVSFETSGDVLMMDKNSR